MRQNKLKFLLSLSSLILVFSLQAQNRNSILATVNGEPITLLDVISETKDKEERMMSVYSGSPSLEDLEKLRMSAVERMIEDKIILLEFKSRGYKVPPQMVERMLDSLATEIAEGDRRRLEELALRNKMSIEKLRKKAEDRAAIELMLNEFCSRRINITPRELQEHINEKTKTELPVPQSELYVIFIKNSPDDDSKAALVEKIAEDVKQNNKSIFMTLARLYSETHSSSKGGYLGWMDKDKLRPEFKSALEGVAVGTATSKISTEEGIYFLFLSGNNDGINPNESVTDMEKLKEELMMAKREEARKLFVENLRKNAVIRYFY
ncbi:MAG TPA: peptidylprolyl isomerase [Victivallales bacterium]|nr:peptidylprolyl isomerase [Victivallales bacterium]